MVNFRILCFLLLFNYCYLLAGEVLVLHDNVGAEVDIIEKVHYKLFPNVDNFINAQYFLMPNDSVMAFIQTWNAMGSAYQKVSFSQYEFYLMGQEVGQMEPADRAKIEYLQRKYQPLFAEEHISRLPRNSYCLIILNNNKEYQGVFQKVDQQKIRILDNDQLYDIPIRSIRTLKYWDIDKDAKVLQWLTLGSFSAIGLAGGQLVSFAFSIPANQTGIYTFSGTIIGALAGYRFVPAIIEKLRPKTVIEFRKSKIKRLDSVGLITYTFKKLKGKIWRTHAAQD